MSLSLFTKLLTTSRTIKNSGYNLEGQLDNTDGNLELFIKEPVVRNVYMMDRSTYHTVYVTTDRNIYATGYNGQGQLGIGSTENAYKLTKVILPSYRNITKVVCGGYHTLFLTKTGDVYVTGYNGYGQLGLGHRDNIYTPTKITSLSNVKDIYAGGYHTFFITTSGDVYACGKNDYGQLGLSLSTVGIPTPTLIKGLSDIESISCGGDFTFFIGKGKSKIYVAGYNGYGQLGLSNYTNANTITSLDKTLPADISLKNIEKIVCGSHHTLMLLKNLNVYSCGSNMYGQLGLGKNIEDKNIFTKLNVQGIKNIVTDAYTSIFQVDTKILYGCGHNRNGELGLGDNIHRYEITKLNYTDIWLDDLNEDIITVPEMDFGKKLFIIDGYFISGVGNYIVALDKDLRFRVFNKYSMEEEDLVYFYIEKGVLKFTRNKTLVYDENNTRRYPVEPMCEVINKAFLEDKNTIEFSINNRLFSYSIVDNSMTDLYTHKRLCTSINTDLAVFGGDFVDMEDLSTRFTNYLNQPKIEFQVYQLIDINIGKLRYAFTYYSYSSKNGLYNKNKCKLAFIDTSNNIILAEDSYIKNHENRELFDVTCLTYSNKTLYIGTDSGQLWSLKEYNPTGVYFKLLHKFKGGQIVSLKINDSYNELTKDLIIDNNGRYILVNFNDGRYIKYPLYKIPDIEFKCTGIYFIEDKVYYNIKIKISNFDYSYHSNIRFLLHNTYNELEIGLDEFDSNLELSKTVVFENIALSTYNYLRLNYIYGNYTLGSVYQRMAIVKVNMIYLNERKLILNLSNYSSYDIDVVLESYDNLRDSSKPLETLTVSNTNDHDFLYFSDIPKDVEYINIIARYGDSDEYIINKLKLDTIELKHQLKQTGYNDEILLDFDRLFNRIYENKMIDDISFDLICSLLNGMSHKKFESVNDLSNYKLDENTTESANGTFVPILSDRNSNHYATNSNPDNVRYRDHMRANIFINGLKVPYKDVQNIFDMKDGIFTSYYRDKSVTLNADKNIVDVSMYSESLKTSEKELYTIRLDRYPNIVDKLSSLDGYDFYVPVYSDYLDISYIQIYFKFRHGVYWSRINDRNYEIYIKERTSEYTVFNLKVYNEVLLKLGGEIHICLNDLDKKNEYIFRDTKANEIKKYKNYFIPLLTMNENGSLITYYTEKSENIEVFVDGHTLTPYVDYKIINLPLHLQVPTLVLFKNPIKNDKKIEISIMKENFLDAKVKDYSKKSLSNSDISKATLNVYKQDSFNPMLENLFDVYINGYKVPSKYNTDNRSFDIIQTALGIPKENRVDYIRFYLEDTEITKFLIAILSLKLLKDTKLKETSKNNTDTISKSEYFNTIKYKELNLLYEDTDKENDGLLYFIFELVDNAFLNNELAIIDCNDKNQLTFGTDVLLDGARSFRLPYITSNIKINTNIDYAKDFYKNDVKEILTEE